MTFGLPASAAVRRRLAALFLLSVIGLAVASMFRTVLKSELLPPQTVYSLGAALSPSPAERQFYRLRREQEALAARARALGQRSQREPADGAKPPIPPSTAGETHAQLSRVAEGYARFLEQHPKHLAARLACADLLDGLGQVSGALQQREIAVTLAPKDASLRNHLANNYVHTGNFSAAFAHYAKAIDLAPREPVYFYNFGTAVFLYRRDAMRVYQLNEQQVFDRAIQLYQTAVRLDPNNRELAAEVAMTYYGIKPLRVEEALEAWGRLYRSVRPGVQRQHVALHLARVNIEAGRHKAARGYLAEVTHQYHQRIKGHLETRLAELEDAAKPTKVVPASFESQ